MKKILLLMISMLLTACLTNTTPTIIADFNDASYGEWSVEGDAFGKLPPKELGQGLVDTYVNGGDGATGTLTSPEFIIDRDYINFLIGAGNNIEDLYIALVIDGKIVKKTTGPGGDSSLYQKSWNVKEFKGQKAKIQIVDKNKGAWGWLKVDHIVLSDKQDTGISGQKVLKVNNDYLIVPVGNSEKLVTMAIKTNDVVVQNFTISLPRNGEARWLAAYPLSHFNLKGKKITLATADGQKLRSYYSDAMDAIKIGKQSDALSADDYQKPYRDQFHATTRRGWNNDPNGMVFHDGKYHLYYQHNPFGIRWGNMHWGHFESKDLLHWEEKPLALYQKTTSDYMFSGGGVVDFNNSGGYGSNTIWVAFTSTGRGECLAYSTDGGLTFTEISENPVIKHSGRDPKIIWYQPEQKWVLVVYSESACPETKGLDSNRHMAFYESKDLHKWTRTGGFTDSDQAAIYECPEFFALDYNGEKKWVLYGAQNRYYIGDFDGKKFIKESGPYTRFGSHSPHGAFYAAQTFSDEPKGRRIQIAWLGTPLYTDSFPDQIFNQSFTLPHELTLTNTTEGLRMLFNPVKELENLRVKELKSLNECKDNLTEVLIEFENEGHHNLVINGIDASFHGRKARIFNDRTTCEIYSNDGEAYEVHTRSPQNFESYETVVKNGKIKSLKIYELKSIHKSK